MLIKKKKVFFKTENIFLVIIILFILAIAFQLPSDPDMGWHLKNGEYLINHHWQVPSHDIYSYTMSDFPLVMHEWLTDIIIFFLYQHFGLISLMILFTFITSFAFFLVARTVKSQIYYQLIASLLGAIASLPIISVRAQMITLLGLAVIIYLVYQYKARPTYRSIYLLPLIFLLWVNLHGGFSVGLLFIALFIGVEFIKIFIKKVVKIKFIFKLNYTIFKIRDLFKLVILFFVSCLATLINPYQLRVYYEVITTSFDTYAKGYIGEWLPLTLDNPMSYRFIAYAIFMAFLILFSIKKIDFTYLVISLVFFFISISSWRHMPFFILISIPYWIYLVKYLTADKLLQIIRKKWLIAILIIVFVIFIGQKINFFAPIINSQEVLAKTFAYPYQAVQYLKSHPPTGLMFNEYNWGGYLIWQYPEKKVFIDGRMPSWRLKHPNGETQEILKDFRIIRDVQEGWDLLLLKYQIGFVLLYRDAPLAWILEKKGWQILYEDNLSIILKKPD